MPSTTTALSFPLRTANSAQPILANHLRIFKSKKRRPQPQREITVDMLLNLWLDNARSGLKPTTFSTYRSICESHLRPALGNFALSQLKSEDLQCFLVGLNGRFAPATIRGIATVLKKVVEFGGSYSCCASPDDCMCSCTPVRSSVTALTDDEQRRIVSVLTNNLTDRNLGILLCLKTGLRLGEICALRWEDIDLGHGMLKVCRTVSRIKSEKEDSKTLLYVGRPKTADSFREIPLPPRLLELLRQGCKPDGGFVVSGKADLPCEPRTMQRSFKTILKQAQVRDVNFHVLRHSFATKCVERGFDIKSLSMILGHSDVNITLNTYVHPSCERLRSMMSLLDE